MGDTNHRLPPEKYRQRLADLEASGLFSVGDLRSFARLFVGDDDHPALPITLPGSGYIPSPSASLGWSTTNPFPLSLVAFRVPYSTVKDYVSWMNDMVRLHRQDLDYLGITTSLEIYAHGHIPRDHRNIVPLLSLWNRDSHTFISRFHEFTIT